MNEILDNYLFEAFSHASENTYIYVTDMKKDLSRWSSNAVDYFGLEDEYIYNAKDMWLQHIHPDDREEYLKDISTVFSGQSASHNCQYRALNKYGKYVWLECSGSVIRDENNIPAVFAGMITRIDHQSKYDPLTHLLTAYELFRTPFEGNGSVMLLGIDKFRALNSQQGILYGNKILIFLSDVLKDNVDSGVIYRFSGDEFIIYSKNKSASEMEQIFYRIWGICKSAEARSSLHGFSVSAGIVEFNSSENDSTTILSRAELSLANAKEEDTKHCTIFTPELESTLIRKSLVSEALLKSIKNNFEGFRLVYQPILSNSGEEIIGCEALLRWNPNDENIGACYPDEFISILESNGRIHDVGYFVMQEALRQLGDWQKRYKKFNVSFNVSYIQLQDPKFVPAIVENVRMHNIDPKNVIVELTESVLATDTDMLKTSFRLLKQEGIKIALDDFGTGNSSFWTLHNIDVDVLKLDQSFIRGLENEASGIDYAIVESIGIMCNRIGYYTVAEGVENDEIWNMIKKFGFTGLQGYLFSRPIEVADFEKFLVEHNMALN